MRSIYKELFFGAVILGSLGLHAAEYKAYGNPAANKKGTIYLPLDAEPGTLNPYKSTDTYGSEIHGYTHCRLLTKDPETYENVPDLAESFEVSKDGLTFTFKLREGATFHDGKPVRAEDVKFAFDSFRNPDYGAAHLIPYYENIKEVKILDPKTVQVTTKETYFKNIETIGSVHILPEHIYKDPKAKTNKISLGCGPYKLEKYDIGRSITLSRYDKFYGNSVSHLKDQNNFDKIVYRFVKQEDTRLEMLKKGEIDFLGFMTNEAFVKKMQGAGYEKVTKVKVENQSAKGYGAILINLKNPILSDLKVRKALAHLLNRREMNKKFRYDMSDLQSGPIYGRSPYASPNIKPIEFDPTAAQKLLAEAGWKDDEKKGILSKTIDGKKYELKLSILNPNPDFEKYLTFYKEDLKKSGIQLNIQQVEWNTLTKAMDEKNFDLIPLGWSGEIEYDPKQIWHTDSQRKGGSNYISYSNPTVDKLIDEVRKELDRKKRIEKMHKITELIADDLPYIFMFSERYDKYAHNQKVQKLKDTYKFSVGFDYMWLK